MIEKTKSLVLEKFTKANGYEFDSQVIYGDTDSVMVKFGTSDIETKTGAAVRPPLYVPT